MEIEEGTSIDHDDGAATTNDDDNCIDYPLFMDGLPHNFSTNPALAAIASLMNDETNHTDDGDGDDATVAQNTSTKSSTRTVISVAKRNDKTKYKPYNDTTTNRRRRRRNEKSSTNQLQHDGTAAVVTTDTTEDGPNGGGSDTDRNSNTAGTSANTTTTKPVTTTIGEASMYLKMWKL